MASLLVRTGRVPAEQLPALQVRHTIGEPTSGFEILRENWIRACACIADEGNVVDMFRRGCGHATGYHHAVTDLARWCTSVPPMLAKDLRGDPFWSKRLRRLQSKSSANAIHLEVFQEPWLTYLLDGTKTVESRFSVRRFAPYGLEKPGDAISARHATHRYSRSQSRAPSRVRSRPKRDQRGWVGFRAQAWAAQAPGPVPAQAQAQAQAAWSCARRRSR